MHGYSSSEESEDPKRPRALPATSSTTTDKTKKKKKKPAPQQAINRIWKKLQVRKPTVPLAVLPFDPVLPPASPDRANEPSSAGYERAAEECRRKVRKIIKECRRVNMRYRDPGYDLVSFSATAHESHTHTPPLLFCGPRLCFGVASFISSGV